MEKQKKSKLKNILFYISIALNLLFIFILTIGLIVNSSSKKTNTRVNASTIDTQFQLSNYYDVEIEWDETITTCLGYVDEGDDSYLEFYNLENQSNFGIAFYIPINFEFVIDNEVREGGRIIWFVSNVSSNYGNITIEYEGIEGENNWEVYDSHTGGWLNENYRRIKINDYDFDNYSDLHYFLPYMYNNSIYLNEDKFKTTFNFANSFNFNAPYFNTQETTFNIDANSTGNNFLSRTYNVGYFYSNGQYFNQVVVNYMGGLSSKYIDQNGNLATQTNSQAVYYAYMEYVNSISEVRVSVNHRNYITWTDENGGSGNAITKSSTWVNVDYQTLIFQDQLSPSNKDNLAQFNNHQIDETGIGYIPTEVGLANTFSLLGSAFGSFASIFAIQLLPGITIGLLFFMPLIVGIILFIIWLIKR